MGFYSLVFTLSFPLSGDKNLPHRHSRQTGKITGYFNNQCGLNVCYLYMDAVVRVSQVFGLKTVWSPYL